MVAEFLKVTPVDALQTKQHVPEHNPCDEGSQCCAGRNLSRT